MEEEGRVCGLVRQPAVAEGADQAAVEEQLAAAEEEQLAAAVDRLVVADGAGQGVAEAGEETKRADEGREAERRNRERTAAAR